MRSRRVLMSTAAAAVLVLTVGAVPATAAEQKRGDAAQCPTGRQHVISSTTDGTVTHRDLTGARTWKKGTGTSLKTTTRTGSEAAYTWQINAGTITTGGSSCSIL